MNRKVNTQKHLHNPSRRSFLRTISAGGLSLALAPFSTTALANGTITGKKLVILNLRGACDTVNAFPPYLENNYYDIRPTINIPQGDILNLSGSDLGLHPSMQPLQGIWDAGDMALFPATHCGTNPNRSHFYQYDFYDRGDYTTSNVFNNGKGWLARYLNTQHTQSTGIEAYSFWDGNKIIAGGNIPLLSASNPEAIDLGTGEALSATIKALLRSNISTTTRAGVANTWADTQEALFSRLDTIDSLDLSSTNTYPSSTLGKQFRQTAGLLRNLPELEVVLLRREGWDTHANQGGVTGNHANMLTDIAGSLGSFYDDLSTAERENVMVLVHTEFGRTAHENGSNGTDHGHAAAWWVIGGANINGGQKTAWPGFGTNDLANARYTAQVTDYRDIISQVLHRHMGASQQDAESCFPGYSYSEADTGQFITSTG